MYCKFDVRIMLFTYENEGGEIGHLRDKVLLPLLKAMKNASAALIRQYSRRIEIIRSNH